MLLKGKTRNIELSFTMKKIASYEELICEKETDTLLATLPSMIMGKKSIQQLVVLLNHFQDGDKLPINNEDGYDLYDFLDEYVETNKESSITSLYLDILKEFDMKGAIAKGMGFMIANKVEEMLNKTLVQMEKE